MKKRRLGEVLTERGKISAADLNKALQLQKEKPSYLGELLLQAGLVSKDDLVTSLGELAGVPYCDCSKLQPRSDTLLPVTAQLARKYCVLPGSANAPGNRTRSGLNRDLRCERKSRFVAQGEWCPVQRLARKIYSAAKTPYEYTSLKCLFYELRLI
jgi:hypothetical protein